VTWCLCGIATLNKIVTTSDGSHTIFVPELNEHYHSVHGAVQESEFIFIKNGFDQCKADPVRIFEIGFGTGLNALLTAVKAIELQREVFYSSIERYPLDEQKIKSLNHQSFAGTNGKEIFNLIHSAGWGVMCNITPFFRLLKIRGDLIKDRITGSYDLIYFDAFGPDKQPEMWTREILAKISEITVTGGLFVTYSAKGEVKRNLKACGFTVKVTDGPPGKRHMVRAIKI
jgi:tRNA U34 5-methylaminomethyl-2-thiouridine-forming methyltransferase MnmC